MNRHWGYDYLRFAIRCEEETLDELIASPASAADAVERLKRSRERLARALSLAEAEAERQERFRAGAPASASPRPRLGEALSRLFAGRALAAVHHARG